MQRCHGVGYCPDGVKVSGPHVRATPLPSKPSPHGLLGLWHGAMEASSPAGLLRSTSSWLAKLTRWVGFGLGTTHLSQVARRSAYSTLE